MSPRLALFLGVLAASGCGGDELAKVSGTALRGGRPVPRLGIHFVPDKGLSSHGLTDENGHFELLYSTGAEGAVIGSHKVWVQLPPDPARRGELRRRAADPEIEAILLKYGNSETTPLTVEVREGQDEIKLPLD